MRNLFLKQLIEQLQDFPPVIHLGSAMANGPFPVVVEGGQGGFLPFVLAAIGAGKKGSSLVLVPTEKEAENLSQDLNLVENMHSVRFPWWGCVPYGDSSPFSSIFADRVQVLARLLRGEDLLVVTSVRALLSPVPDPGHLNRHMFRLRKTQKLDTTSLRNDLSEMGYLRVPRVSVKGEFALRGEVIDIFIPDRDEAVRIVVNFDEIEEIRLFDPASQSSLQIIDEVTVPPIREVIFDEEALSNVTANLSKGDVPEELAVAVADELRDDHEKPGCEVYYPLCFEKQFSLLDYLNSQATVFMVDKEIAQRNAASQEREVLDLFRKVRREKPSAPRPKDIVLSLPQLVNGFGKTVIFPTIRDPSRKSMHIDLACDPPRSFFGNFPYLRDELSDLLKVGYRVAVFAEYQAQASRISSILQGLDVEVVPLSLSGGFLHSGLKTLVIQENEIFGRKRRIPRSVQQAKSQAIDSFIDLNPGDHVVHINYGIGRFKGIDRIHAAGNVRDYIHLEYADGEVIFLPIEQVNLIQKYIAHGDGVVRLDKIGGKSWENRKKRVQKSVEDLARRLVVLYATRRKTQGHAFSADSEWQGEFEGAFPYQETEDQLRCIEDVKGDMEQASPMDRLICGDVGYGKTEIALRASFKAVMDGKQVALLAPTTILVEQHYETFLDRFDRFPVKIAMLSRFRSRQDQDESVKALKAGEADIVIGTHRLLQKDIGFKDLGLLVVDEEQRFGVKHKEVLKELKAQVDCLTLTATPIPRTLHMSLMKIRDMSVLNTPPLNRQPIETHVEEFNPEIVAKAIRNEVARNGQIYYLHNRIRTIWEIKRFLEELLPDVTIHVAHGQMESEELEDIMHRFVHGEFQVLLATTIIENGLDIPNVNTIIIDRADMFGVSQLYQLKGRVGRSDTLAYAYLLYPEQRDLTELAIKRLRIISDFTELGSGFKIALKDLEIRGAGNLLGREQSGDILAVGLDMYVRLLDEAISALDENDREPVQEVYLELEYSGYIPDSYIPDPMEKMEVYKKIAAISTDIEHDSVAGEITDRFGPMPDEVMSIMSISEIRIICRKLKIATVKENSGVVTVEFALLSHIDVNRVLGLIEESGGRVYLDSHKPHCLFLKTGTIGLKEKSEYIKDRLSRIV